MSWHALQITTHTKYFSPRKWSCLLCLFSSHAIPQLGTLRGTNADTFPSSNSLRMIPYSHLVVPIWVSKTNPLFYYCKHKTTGDKTQTESSSLLKGLQNGFWSGCVGVSALRGRSILGQIALIQFQFNPLLVV